LAPEIARGTARSSDGFTPRTGPKNQKRSSQGLSLLFAMTNVASTPFTRA
jgi:hypothetical protein